MGQACEYDLLTQVHIWVAFAAIFTFNQRHDPNSVFNNLTVDNLDDEEIEPNIEVEEGGERVEMLLGGQISEEEHSRAEQCRDRIAIVMWNSYQAELERREQVN